MTLKGFPQSYLLTPEPASSGCRHHSSSLAPQKDVVNPSPHSHPQLVPRAHPEMARQSDCPLLISHTPTHPALAQKEGAPMTERVKGHLAQMNSPQTDWTQRCFLFFWII